MPESTPSTVCTVCILRVSSLLATALGILLLNTFLPLPFSDVFPQLLEEKSFATASIAMLSTASILASSFAGSAAHRAGSSITMQATTTLNGLPGTPGGPEFAKTLPGVVAPFGYL